jgi:predicted transglutaminase-like cysteine proteinase
LAAGLVLLLSPPTCFAVSTPLSLSNEIEAISFMEHGATTASLEPNPAPIESDSQAAALFGMETEPLIAGTVLEKWTRAKSEIAVELETVAYCRANDACPAVAQKLIDLSAAGAGRTGRARVGSINRAVDLAIKPTSDEAQWGVADRWSAPFETLRSGRGDCEDYAIVKYVALLEAGLSEDDMKIVILKRVFPNEDHAVLAVRVDGNWLILDNRTLTLVRDRDLTRAMPELVLDRNGVRRFVSRGRA